MTRHGERCGQPLSNTLYTARARPSLTEGLGELLKAAVRRSRAQGRPVLVSRTIPVRTMEPIAFFARGPRIGGARRFVAVPARGLFLVGLGDARVLTGHGASRFRDVAAAWRQLLDGAVVERDPGAPAPCGPVLIGGFSFDPLRPSTPLWDGFPDAAMALPRFQLSVGQGAACVTVNAVVEPETDPGEELARLEGEERALDIAPLTETAPEVRAIGNGTGAAARGGAVLTFETDDPEPWKAEVAAAAGRIRAGELEKVVLARRTVARVPRPLSLSRILAALVARHPAGYVFAMAHGERCFLGASPEQLVQLEGGEVRAMCLAGTARRDPDEAMDRELGERLLTDPKEREEHAVVARALREGLAPLCTDLHMPAEPTLMRLPDVQHLFTPVSGRVAGGHTVLDFVERLHPTPAVGGFPRDVALALIRDVESLDRGWYAAPVGWVDHRGEGEFAVAIRSALVHGREASLFSGCGIMGDSNPEAELEESRVKLAPMMSALAAGVTEEGGT